MRTIQIKVWPEIRSQIPAIIPLERIARDKKNPINIDFSNTYSCNSSGLTILLISLLKIGKDLITNNWDATHSKDNQINENFSDLNFFKYLVTNVPNSNLFWYPIAESPENSKPITKSDDGFCLTAYPIYELKFRNAGEDKREIVEVFKQKLIAELYFLMELYDFELHIFIQILVEMAKNTADHTDSNAYFGLDIYENEKKLFLKFAFGDLGIGINQKIREYIKSDNSFKDKARHLALTDSYHYALSVGTTTKPNSKLNKGIGMSTIFNLSKQINFRLSVYDAESRGFLSEAVTSSHVELRRIFYSLGFKVGFYYFGELEINKV